MTLMWFLLNRMFIYNDSGQKARPHNSSYPKGGVSCFKDSFVGNGSLVFQIKFYGKSPALQVAAKRHSPLEKSEFENSFLLKI